MISSTRFSVVGMLRLWSLSELVELDGVVSEHAVSAPDPGVFMVA